MENLRISKEIQGSVHPSLPPPSPEINGKLKAFIRNSRVRLPRARATHAPIIDMFLWSYLFFRPVLGHNEKVHVIDAGSGMDLLRSTRATYAYIIDS